MGLRAKSRIAELEARIVELEAEVAGEKAKGVLLQKRAERAEAATRAGNVKPMPVPKTPDPALPNEAGRLPGQAKKPRRATKKTGG